MKTVGNFPSKINYNSLKYIVHLSARMRTGEGAASLVAMWQWHHTPYGKQPSDKYNLCTYWVHEGKCLLYLIPCNESVPCHSHWSSTPGEETLLSTAYELSLSPCYDGGKKKSLPWAGITLHFHSPKSFMTAMQVIYAHIKIGAYNPTETTELIQLIRKIAVPQKAHNCQIVQNLLPFVNMWHCSLHVIEMFMCPTACWTLQW